MDDLEKRIEKLRKYKTFNFYLALLATSFMLFLVIRNYFFFYNLTGQNIALIYLGINMLVTIIFLFQYVRNISKAKFKNQLEKYQEIQVNRTLVANNMAPYIFFIPIFLGNLGIIAIIFSQGYKPNYWMTFAVFFILVVGLYRRHRTRKFLLKEYKKIHGVNYLSIF